MRRMEMEGVLLDAIPAVEVAVVPDELVLRL
jgi:hypothetical protein